MKNDIVSRIQRAFEGVPFDGSLCKNAPLKKHTTFKIGGDAAVLLNAASAGDIEKAIVIANENGIPFFVMGNGSNVLARDEGYAGIVIRLSKAMAQIRPEGAVLHAQAGALLSQIASAALERFLTGFEFAGGIPGSAGGALVMNAGAYGGEMADIVVGAKVVRRGEVVSVSPAEMDLCYRHSSFMGSDDVIVEVSFRLTPGDPQKIREKMEDLRAQRNFKQPMHLPSAGSAFKRPKGSYASKLIDECGLKGLSVGGAQVSPKHAGFVVNNGGATARDVIDLTEKIIEIVFAQTGYRLEREFIIL
ncbi:MAG: UDP-N-acetylmuramate dehydrogenase [Christensenellales bacterium]